MSQASNTATGFLRVATQFNNMINLITGGSWDLNALTTTQKASIVAAINEVKAQANALAAGSGAIDDAATGTSTTWSSSKINDEIAAAISVVLGGADAAYNTLKELQDAVVGNDGDLEGILTALGNRVRFDAPQTLTAPQQAQARANIGAASALDVGDTNTNFVEIFENALIQ